MSRRSDDNIWLALGTSVALLLLVGTGSALRREFVVAETAAADSAGGQTRLCRERVPAPAAEGVTFARQRTKAMAPRCHRLKSDGTVSPLIEVRRVTPRACRHSEFVSIGHLPTLQDRLVRLQV